MKSFSTPVVITSSVIDRWDGLSHTFEVWGATPSNRYVAQILADADNRNAVAQFFVSRAFAGVFKDLVKLRTVQPSDCFLSKTELFEALLRKLSTAQAGVVMELILPSLVHFGMVSNAMKYSVHVRYAFQTVTTDAIRNDVAVYQVMQAVKAASTASISRDTKYSVSTLAELLSEEYRKIGLQLYEINDLASIVGDIISGVRAAIDPSYSDGAISGSISPDWIHSRVIEETSKNLVFVKAALSIPPGTNISLQNEGWKLNQWGPIILAALQSSERYAWVSKSEVLRTYGLKKMRDTRGRVKSAILYRSAKVTPVAQTVFPIEDSLMTGAYNINATKDRISDVIQTAYGSATFDVAMAAFLYKSVVTDLVEAGWNGAASVTEFDIEEGSLGGHDLCCLLASRLYVQLPDASDAIPIGADDDGPNSAPSYAPVWRFVVPTTERDADYTLYAGTEHRGEEVFTEHREVVLMAHPEFDAVESVAPRPQVFGPAAFSSRLVDFDERVVHRNKNRFAFSATVNGVSIRGSIRPANFASMRANDFTSVVIPHFNKSVIDEHVRMIVTTLDAVTRAERDSNGWLNTKPGEAFFALMRRRVARHMLNLAKALAPGYRKEINDAIIDRALAGAQGLTLEEELIMRARLAQQSYAAFSDMMALEFFLFIQGLSNEALSEIIVSEDMMKTYLEIGSDS